MQKSRRNRWFLVLGVWLFFITSCRSFYMVEGVPLDPSDKVFGLVTDTTKYVIVHYKNGVIHLSDVTVDKTRSIITGKAEAVPSEHGIWREQTGDRGIPYHKNEFKPVDEVHVFASTTYSKQDSLITIKLEEVDSVKAYLKDKERSDKAYKKKNDSVMDNNFSSGNWDYCWLECLYLLV